MDESETRSAIKRLAEELLIRRTLAEITTHRERAAAILGISPRALHYKLRRMGIESEGVVEHPPDPGDTSKNG